MNNPTYLCLRHAYYETNGQASLILDISNNQRISGKLNRLLDINDKSQRRSLDSLHEMSYISKNIIFVKDEKNKMILAVAPVPPGITQNGLDTLSANLSRYTHELQNTFLATPLLDMMPTMSTEDKERALFYLYMSAWYRKDIRSFYLPIDWNDILKQWTKSRSFHFFRPIKADSLKQLIALLAQRFRKQKKVPGLRFVIWVDCPEDCDEDIRVVPRLIFKLREHGYSAILGLNNVPMKMPYQALLFIMTD